MILTPFDYWLPSRQPESLQERTAKRDVDFNAVFEHIFNPRPEPPDRNYRLQVLRSHPIWTTQEFAQALNISMNAAYEWLDRCCRRGEAICVQKAQRHRHGFMTPNQWTALFPQK